MNNNALQFRVRPCIVCGFPFSDEHHIHPEILGREKSPTVILCPNHHRLAHIVQGMVINNYPETSIFAFADQTLDTGFNAIGLPLLLNAYKELVQKFKEQLGFSLQEGEPVMVCIDCDYRKEEHVYRWGILKRIGILSSIVYVPFRRVEVEIRSQEIKVIDSEEEKETVYQLTARFESIFERGITDRGIEWVLDHLSRYNKLTKLEEQFLLIAESHC